MTRDARGKRSRAPMPGPSAPSQEAPESSNRIAGIQSVREALVAAPNSIQRIWLAAGRHDRRLTELRDLARSHQIPVYQSARGDLDRLSRESVPHHGVVAEIAPVGFVELSVLAHEVEAPRLVLALDQIEDPRNFGALVRTADGAGAHGVIVPHRRSAPVSAAAISASAGAMFHVPLIRVRNLADALNELKKRGFWIVGLDAGASMRWDEADLCRSVVLVVGSEGKGLRPRIRKVCDLTIGLPQLGDCGSLNVSVAAGIVLYEAVRQRFVGVQDSSRAATARDGPSG